MNAKISVVVICVEAIIYLLLHNLHDCTFNICLQRLYFFSVYIINCILLLEMLYSFSAISEKIKIPIPPCFTGSDSSFLFHFVAEMSISKGRNEFCIYSLIQFFEMFADVRNGPNCVCDFMFKTTNKRSIHCLWRYHSYFT